MKAQTVTIIGVDRLTTAMGLALKKAPIPLAVLGHDGNLEVAKAAVQQGAFDKAEMNLINAAAKADILVLSLPVAELKETLQLIGADVPAHALVLDISSLKGRALQWATEYLQRGHYIGAIPVLSPDSLEDGRAVIHLADPDMFQNSLFCLMPAATVVPQAVETAVNFGKLLGATPYFLDPLEYDGLTQGLETMPGLLAAVMFDNVQRSAGWRDMARFAGIPFALMTQPLQQSADVPIMAMDNKEATLRWLDRIINQLRDVRRWVYEDELELLETYLTELGMGREKWLHEREKNDWADLQSLQDIETPTMSEQLFGSWGRRDRSS